MEPAERQLKAGVDGQVALEAEQERACGGAASEGDQPEERGMVPGAQQLPEAASDPCGADWSGICRSAAPPEPVEAVRSAGGFDGREQQKRACGGAACEGNHPEEQGVVAESEAAA